MSRGGYHGVVPVMGRVTINGTQSQFFDKRSGRAERSCKKTIPLDMLDVKGRSNLFALPLQRIVPKAVARRRCRLTANLIISRRRLSSIISICRIARLS